MGFECLDVGEAVAMAELWRSGYIAEPGVDGWMNLAGVCE